MPFTQQLDRNHTAPSNAYRTRHQKQDKTQHSYFHPLINIICFFNYLHILLLFIKTDNVYAFSQAPFFLSENKNSSFFKKELEKFNESSGPTFKMKNDPRIYPMGRILRKFSLDELPQLFNILAGDMSVVGPRPPLPSEVKEYLPWHKMRLSVTPGLTCFWQVSGRSDIGFEEWMRLDNKYVRHGNFGTDIQLIAKTFKAIFKSDGAY
ncbi:sugar transferase [Fibrobacter sp. UWS1]|nr:sugar transferase [Fibrobacter sp. UWS1]